MNSEHKSICKSIYADQGLNGILLVLRSFPERLHEEILEDLSMNMIEWENKLRVEEKEDLSRDLSNLVDVSKTNIHCILNSIKENSNDIDCKINKAENDRVKLILTIKEFPSICPERDIESISVITEELEELRKLKSQTETKMKYMVDTIDRKSQRMNDCLF